MDKLAHELSIVENPAPCSDPQSYSTDSLFGNARGKMFGVMECLASDGSKFYLKAFSGQYNGEWMINGWAPPLFDVDLWTQVNTPAERHIKEMGKSMQGCGYDSEIKQNLGLLRKRRSQQLMKDLHALYRLTNFRGLTLPLTELFHDRKGIPTGTGDCCAPKLLNFAAVNNLVPLGIAEFFWGRDNKSGDRRHGRFYSPCEKKCRPLLGYLLCGLEKIYADLGL